MARNDPEDIIIEEDDNIPGEEEGADEHETPEHGQRMAQQGNVIEQDEGEDEDETQVKCPVTSDGRTGNIQGTGCCARCKVWVKKKGLLKPQRLSALLLFLLVFAISLALTIGEYLGTERFPKYRVSWLIVSLEVIASVVLVCLATTKPAHVDLDDDDRQPWQKLIRRNIRLFGIVPFFFAIFVFDSFRFCFNLKCSDAWTACASGDVREEHMADLLSPVLRFVYLLIELIVCVKLNEAVFSQNLPILLGLAIVEATNLSCWLDALVDESIVFSSESNWTYELSRCFNGTNASVSDHFIQCYSHTSPEFHLLEFASPYLYPFIMEYLMLVMECVADWFFSDAENLESAALTAKEPAGVNAELEDFSAGDRQGDNELLIPGTPTGRDNYCCPRFFFAILNRCTRVFNCVVVVPTRCPCFFSYVVVIVLLGVLFLVLGIFALFVGNIEYWNTLITYHLIYWTLMILSAVIGYVVSFRFPPGSTKNPSGFEFFVILLSLGPIMQCILSTVAITRTEDFLVPTGLFVIEEMLNLVQVVVQVFFYEKTKTARTQSQGSEVSGAILKCIIVSFIVCNFALWVEDSFIETATWTTSWQKYYFEKWPLVYNIFGPMSLMFRFNSALLFLNLLFDSFDNKAAAQNSAVV